GRQPNTLSRQDANNAKLHFRIGAEKDLTLPAQPVVIVVELSFLPGPFRAVAVRPPRRWKRDESTMAMTSRPKRGVPEGLWMRCPQCKATIFRKEAENRFNVCPECEYHFYLPARERIQQLLDQDSFEEWFADLR